MVERILCSGNEAVARGAIAAGCKYFFGYPITPQSDIPEYMSRELPKIGGSYVQSESEVSSVYMVYAGALAGARVMTSTSSPGYSLMQEGTSYIAELEAPCVIVNVVRMGPGIGTGGQGSQTDYRQAVNGGGHGGYRNIVLAPASPQEVYDLMQRGFYLADKYRIMVLVLSDFIIGQLAEIVELKTIDFPPLPEKAWALMGKDKKNGRRDIHMAAFLTYGSPNAYWAKMVEKYTEITENEVRYDTYRTEDAKVLLVAYGSSARISMRAVDLAQEEGLKAGLFRPITLWPFAKEQLRSLACKCERILVVEDSAGQLVEDVENITQGKVPVSLLGLWGRHKATASGIIHPERVLQEVRNLYEHIK